MYVGFVFLLLFFRTLYLFLVKFNIIIHPNYLRKSCIICSVGTFNFKTEREFFLNGDQLTNIMKLKVFIQFFPSNLVIFFSTYSSHILNSILLISIFHSIAKLTLYFQAKLSSGTSCFNILNCNLVWPPDYHPSHQIVIPQQERSSFLISRQLFNYITFQFNLHLSSNAVYTNCKALWNALGCHAKFLTANCLKKIFLTFTFCKVMPALSQQQQNFIAENCVTVSADHTYKTCKYLKAFTQSKQKVFHL